jgi:hypothetical protein
MLSLKNTVHSLNTILQIIIDCFASILAVIVFEKYQSQQHPHRNHRRKTKPMILIKPLCGFIG